MNVAVDTGVIYMSRAGTARYVRGLLRALRGAGCPDLSVSELAWPVYNLDYRQPARALKTMYREWYWAPVAAPRALARSNADILHQCSSLPIECPPSVKRIATLYDVAAIRHPERYRRWHRLSEPRRMKRLHLADRIVCISRFTADEAMDALGLPAGKIDVVYPGTDFDLRSGLISAEDPPFEIPDRYFLFVGSLEPGKNLELLRQAYLLSQTRGIELPPLLIVGARWPGVQREGGHPRDWQYAGYQADGVLMRLYSRALALLFPSMYEGFGLPVLEAMSSGCPVVCHKAASLPEVGGDAVCYADSTADAWLDAMTIFCRDATFREDLKRSGLTQSLKFSWKKFAKETISVYRGALNNDA